MGNKTRNMYLNLEFNGGECNIDGEIRVENLQLVSYQTQLGFNNITPDFENAEIIINGSTVQLGEALVSTVAALSDLLQSAIQSVVPLASVNYSPITSRLSIDGLTSIQFVNNTGLMFGFDASPITTFPATGPNPVNLLPFRSMNLIFDNIDSERRFLTNDNTTYDLIIPFADKDFSIDGVFYGRESYTGVICDYNVNGGQLRHVEMQTYVTLNGVSYRVNVPPNMKTTLLFKSD